MLKNNECHINKKAKINTDHPGGSSLMNGDIVTVVSTNKTGSVSVVYKNSPPWGIDRSYMNLYAEIPEEIKEQIKGLQAEIKEEKSKLEFIREAGYKDFNEDEFRVWKALDLIEGAKSRTEKVKALAKLLK